MTKASATIGSLRSTAQNNMPNARPNTVSPALTLGKRAGHWIGPRRRRMTHREAARLQGYVSRSLTFDNTAANNFFLIGNTMSVPVLERIWIVVMRAQGYAVPDPWEIDQTQQDLKNDAASGSLSPSQCQHIHAQKQNSLRTADRRRTNAHNHPTTASAGEKNPTVPPHHDTPKTTRALAKTSDKAKKSKDPRRGSSQPITNCFQRSDGKPTVKEPMI